MFLNFDIIKLKNKDTKCVANKVAILLTNSIFDDK